jgi:hypothetical protein
VTASTDEILGSAVARLAAVAPYLLADPTALPALRERGAGALFTRLVEDVRASKRDDHVWLLCVGLTGAFPLPHQVRSARRALLLSSGEPAFVAFLETTFDLAAGATGLTAEIEVVHRGVVVDVDFCASTTPESSVSYARPWPAGTAPAS